MLLYYIHYIESLIFNGHPPLPEIVLGNNIYIYIYIDGTARLNWKCMPYISVDNRFKNCLQIK